jgi:hypothetical protein
MKEVIDSEICRDSGMGHGVAMACFNFILRSDGWMLITNCVLG